MVETWSWITKYRVEFDNSNLDSRHLRCIELSLGETNAGLVLKTGLLPTAASMDHRLVDVLTLVVFANQSVLDVMTSRIADISGKNDFEKSLRCSCFLDT